MHDNDHAPQGGSQGAAAPIFADTQPDPDIQRDLRGEAPAPQRLKVEFTGSGSEYFRIWIVNLLLTIVTLSLYRPFAKARRLAYFHGNTLVGGQPLGFHGDPWKMLRGYLVMLVFGGVYFGSSQFSPVAAGVALVCFAALWPALWRASLQFRLANTSWRGLRFGFDGSLGGAYRAMLPAFIPWLGSLAGSLMMPKTESEAEVTAMFSQIMMTMGLTFVAAIALVPLSLAWVKRYQHGHYLYAGQRTQLEASTGSFYTYAVKVVIVSVLAMVVAGIFFAVVMAVASKGRSPSAMMPIMALGFFGMYAIYFALMLPYGQSRLQNLVWGSTRSQALQFHSELKLAPLGALTLKNLALVICTLGLYWPFAAIATARLRLSAVSIDLDEDLTQWHAGAAAGQNDATGDAAGDFFGIDMGL